MISRVAIGRALSISLVTALLVAASLGAAMYLGATGQVQSKETSASTTSVMVNVFGLASTVGGGTHLVTLSFTDAKTGTTFTAPVSGGKFSIDLPNGATYDVVARWAGNYSWQAGAVDRGGLTVNMSSDSMKAMSFLVRPYFLYSISSVQILSHAC